MIARLLRRLLLKFVRVECPGSRLCRPVVEHGPGFDWMYNDSIRDVCSICGKKGPWLRVIGPF